MDDEDLELLRKAALQSLHTKAKPQETPRPVEKIQPLQTIQQLNPRAAPFIPTQAPSQQWNNFGPQPTPQMHYVPPVVRIPGPGPLPHQQPNFMPNMMPTPPGVPINVPLSIVPVAQQPPNTHVPNVQLSPRSAAFVSQNNDIIMRRQHEKSPGYRSPYRNSPPSRWSPSPPRLRRHSRSKSPNPAQRSYRDKSLSPRRDRRDRDSPLKKNGRWNAGRSANNSPIRRRERSRSPRRGSPTRKKSNSKSPGRRLNRNYNNGRPNNDARRPLRRTSPLPRSSNNRSRDSPTNKNHKNEDRFKSDFKRNNRTPEKAKSRSKSRSLSPGADLAAVLEKLDEDFDIFPMIDDAEPDDVMESTPVTPEVVAKESVSEAMETTTTPESKTPDMLETGWSTKKSLDDVNEDELLGMSDDEISLGGNDIELDDLFNSDDSESENEGRFKSGAKTNKAKPTTVMPFAKLGASSVSASVTSELTPNDRRETNRNDDRRRRDDNRRDWRGRPGRLENRKEEPAKEESVLKKFKPIVEDKKRSNTPDIRVPSISSTVKTVAREMPSSVRDKPMEKRTIQLKRPISSLKDDSKVKENITITTGSSSLNDSQKKDETRIGSSLIKSSIRSRLGDKISEQDSKPLTSRSLMPGSGTSTAKTVRAKITWNTEKVSISYFPLIDNVSLFFFDFLF